MPASPYGDIGGMDLGGAIQNQSGIPSDFVSAAQALGFMPNPNASVAQQLMDATRFLSMTKNINDRMMGTDNAWTRLNPTNPVAAMPMYMRNMYNAYNALVNSPAGMNLLPQSAVGSGMFGGGNYVRGPLGNDMSALLAKYLGQQVPTQQPNAADAMAAQTGVGPTPGGNPAGGNAPAAGGGGGGAPTPSAQSGINEGTSRGMQGPTIPGLSGVNDMVRNIPLLGGAVSGAENAIGDLTGRSDTQGGGNIGGGVPVLSGLNDMARLTPGIGGLEDIVGGLANAATGRNGAVGQTPGGGGASAVTVNPAGTGAPRSLGLLLQRMGMNSIPQGVDPNAFVDNALYKILGGQ